MACVWPIIEPACVVAGAGPVLDLPQLPQPGGRLPAVQARDCQHGRTLPGQPCSPCLPMQCCLAAAAGSHLAGLQAVLVHCQSGDVLCGSAVEKGAGVRVQVVWSGCERGCGILRRLCITGVKLIVYCQAELCSRCRLPCSPALPARSPHTAASAAVGVSQRHSRLMGSGWRF